MARQVTDNDRVVTVLVILILGLTPLVALSWGGVWGGILALKLEATVGLAFCLLMIVFVAFTD